MLGYIIAAAIGLIAIGFAFSSLGGGSPPARKKTSDQRLPKPVQQDQPAADEPTPDRSLVASRREIENAKQHTPPA